MSALLAVAVFGPAAAVALARIAPTAMTARRWVAGADLALAAAWALLAVIGEDAGLGRFGTGQAPAAAGTWLLAASITWPARRLPLALATMAAGVAAGGLALVGGTGDLTDAAGGLAAAAAVLVAAARSECDGGLVPALATALGAAAAVLGVAWETDLLAGLGAIVAVGATGWRARRAGAVALPAAVVLAAATLPADWPWLLLLAGAATALAHRPAVALALWAVAAAALGVDVVLAGAAAVLVAVALHPLVAVTALPAMAAAIPLVGDRSSPWGFVLAVLAVLTVARLWQRPADVVPGPPSIPTAAVFALGTWVLLAPETWSGGAGLESWGTGVVIAGVAAAVGAFVVASFSEATVTAPAVQVADPLQPAADPRWAWPAGVASVVILAVSGGALVASIVS